MNPFVKKSYNIMGKNLNSKLKGTKKFKFKNV